MILALETGWTDRAIGRLSGRFRAALHWTLYVRTLVGDDGLPDIAIPAGASTADVADAMKRRVAVADLRKHLELDEE